MDVTDSPVAVQTIWDDALPEFAQLRQIPCRDLQASIGKRRCSLLFPAMVLQDDMGEEAETCHAAGEPDW